MTNIYLAIIYTLPFISLFTYEVDPTVDGIAAGKPIQIRYRLTIRCEFVPVGEIQGPLRNFYSNLSPKGKCNIRCPVLDAATYSLGHRVLPTAHCFEDMATGAHRQRRRPQCVPDQHALTERGD